MDVMVRKRSWRHELMCRQLSWNELTVAKTSFQRVPFGAKQIPPAALPIVVQLLVPIWGCRTLCCQPWG